MTSFDDRARQAAAAARDAADDHDLETLLDRIEGSRARPWWLVPASVAAAAAATITAILVVPGMLDGSPTPVVEPVGSQSPGAATAEPTPGGGSPSGLQEPAPRPQFGRWIESATTAGTVLGFADAGDVVVAVGDRGDGPFVLRSRDGAAWDDIEHDLPDGVRVIDVVGIDGVVWVTGNGPDGAAAFSSTDGTTWNEVAIGDGGAQTEVLAVAAHGSQVVAIGRSTTGGRGDGGWLWAADAAGEDSGSLTRPFETATMPLDLAGDGDRLVVLLTGDLGSEIETHVTVAEGPIGAESTWRRHALPATVEVVSLAPADVGVVGAAEGTSGDPVWVSSLDGASWRTHFIDDDRGPRDTTTPEGGFEAVAVTDRIIAAMGVGRDGGVLLHAADTAEPASMSTTWKLEGEPRPVRGSLHPTRLGIFGALATAGDGPVTSTIVRYAPADDG